MVRKTKYRHVEPAYRQAGEVRHPLMQMKIEISRSYFATMTECINARQKVVLGRGRKDFTPIKCAGRDLINHTIRWPPAAPAGVKTSFEVAANRWRFAATSNYQKCDCQPFVKCAIRGALLLQTLIERCTCHSTF
jgi:hypothetical protein